MGVLPMFSDVEVCADVEQKLKRKNKILFSRDSTCLQRLISLMDLQMHRTLVMWALDCAHDTLAVFEEIYPDELRPRKALELSAEWAKGNVRMPQAKRAILDAHAAAKDRDDRVFSALCHAIGQAGSTVHVKTHAIGLPAYELTALVHMHGHNDYPQPVLEKISHYEARLLYWQANIGTFDSAWAPFLA